MYPQNEPQKIHKYRLGIIGAVNIWGKTQQQSRNRHHFMLNSNVVQSHSNNLYRSFITTIKRIKQSALPSSWKKDTMKSEPRKEGVPLLVSLVVCVRLLNWWNFRTN